jgi:dienelactone hydrolase
MRHPLITALLLLLITALLAACTAAPAAETTVTDEVLEQRARELIDQLAAGEYEAARQHFDRTMRTALSQSKLQEVWETIQAQAGSYEKQGEARFENQQNYRIVYIPTRFSLTALDTKVVFNDKGQISGLFFQPASDSTAMAPEYQPPPYADPDTFTEEEVTVGAEGWKLPGTLTLPAGAGPFPAVVLVHGSGPNDRDETIGPNRIFKDLAWGLATQGIAVLRYEKRTREYADQFTAEQISSLTVKEEVIDDALAAVEWLQARPEIDPGRVYLAGHSLGATLAPRIAAQTERLAGIIMLAPAARNLEDLMVEQTKTLANSDGVIDEDEQKHIAELEELVKQIKELPEARNVDPDALILGAGPAYWLDLLGYDPLGTAATLDLPVLILQGERDYQVTMTDFELWRTTLTGIENVTLRSYPTLNHLLIAGEGPSLPEEYQIPGHVDEQVIQTITEFILK